MLSVLPILFLPELPIIFTHYFYFIPMPSPIIPVVFSQYCASDNEVRSLLYLLADKWVPIPSVILSVEL